MIIYILFVGTMWLFSLYLMQLKYSKKIIHIVHLLIPMVALCSHLGLLVAYIFAFIFIILLRRKIIKCDYFHASLVLLIYTILIITVFYQYDKQA